MAIIAQAPTAFASTAVLAGTSKQIVKVNAAGVTAGFGTNYGTNQYFLLPIVAASMIPGRPFRVVARGYYNVVTTTTVAIGLQMAKWSTAAAGPTVSDAFTAVASASLTGAAAPGLAYAWAVDQSFICDNLGNVEGAGIMSAVLPGIYFVGAAAVAPVTIGTQLTSVDYGQQSLTSPLTGIVASQPAYSVAFGINFLNASSNTTADSTFVVESFYAVQD